MKVINLFGGPGSGKSTTAAGLFYKMKLAHQSVDLVTEYAKELVWENRLEAMLDRQEDIFIEQHSRIRRLRGNVDYAITDSPLLLSYIYPRMNQEQKGVPEWPALAQFSDLVVAVNDSYENINVFLERPQSFEANGREHSLEQSETIDVAIKAALVTLEQPFYSYSTNLSTVDIILEHLLDGKL